MTEAQAWRKIAEKLSDPSYNFRFGLCAETYKLWLERGITRKTRKHMYGRCEAHVLMCAHGRDYAYARGKEREARILAALWMAHEVEEEE